MNESTKKAIGGITAAIAIGAVATGIVYFAGESQAYVAKVNGEVIRSAEYDKAFAQTKKQYASRFGVDFATEQGKQVEKDIRKGIVDQLIDRQIVLNEAEKRKVSVADADLDAKLAEIKKGFPNEQAFEKALEDNGLSLNELKTRVREGLVFEAVTKAVTQDVLVTDAEVREHYAKNLASFKKPEEVSASHILVKDEKLAKDVLGKLRGGADFATLAKAHSEDPGSKVQGGDLGFFGKGRMVPEFEAAAFALGKGELSGLVKTQFGYHILKGGEHRRARTQPLAEVEGEIKDRLLKERRQAAFGKWLASEKQKAQIAYKPEFDPTVAAPAPKTGAIDAGPKTGDMSAPKTETKPAGSAHGKDDGHGH